ncbi:MAG: response regulator, partial [Terriglobales bacterium]
PLTSIRGALGLLTSGLVGALPEKGQRMLEIAVNNTDRLVRLINDILDLERMQSGKVAMQRQLRDADALLTQAIDEMQGMAEKAGVALVVTPRQPLRLWVDPDRIVQTLTNLLSNAIKFSPVGGTVWVGATRQGEEAVVTVRDQGRGIPADKVERVFERFQQVDASDARAKGGTGLGLTICRSIVQQHGGRIWVESRLGEGSTFSFTVPLWQEAESAPTVPDGRPLVLACDDDPSVLEVVQAALEQRGYQVVTATTGQEAVTQAEARQPAVILLDILMPRMNGWDTMAALQRKPETCQIPIIIFSILSPQETPLLNSDFVEWVQKSSDETVLLQALKRALEERAKAARVLIVEDDLDLAKVLVAMLRRHGIETAQARTGREAIQQCEQLRPDLLVLDLRLPEGDGFMVADWLRRQDQLRQIPLVIYSARDVDDSERQRLQLGHTEFLTKARITPEEFEHRVMALLLRLVPCPGESPLGHTRAHVGH